MPAGNYSGPGSRISQLCPLGHYCLARLLHVPLPSSVDSVCVAGLLDLLRTAGMWHASVRYGYVYGALELAGNLAEAIPSLWTAEIQPRYSRDIAEI